MTKKKKYLLSIIISSVIFVIFYLITNKVGANNNDVVIGVYIVIGGFIGICCWIYSKICSKCGEGWKKEIHREPIDSYTDTRSVDGGGIRTTHYIIYDVTYECDKCGEITHKQKKVNS